MKFSLVLLITLLFSLSGCRTYHISVSSLQSQFEGIDSSDFKMVRVKGPVGDVVEYYCPAIDLIKCEDKNGNEIELKNSPSIETRITTIDGGKTIFYFDRIFLNGEKLIGHRSRFLGLPKEIGISDIKKIEVQDGHKNFKYVD